MRGLFVIGTDTDVGKTYVTARIARLVRERGTRVGVYKPACSGARTDERGRPRWDDLEQLADALADEIVSLDDICPQRFAAPLAPPSAARREGRIVDSEQMRTAAAAWNHRCDVLFVEGVGGLLCPLATGETVVDLASDLGFPLLLVARAGLGTVNHTLLTLEVARSHGLDIVGIVLNHTTSTDIATVESSRDEIAQRTSVPILAELPHAPKSGLSGDSPLHAIDWNALASIPHPPNS